MELTNEFRVSVPVADAWAVLTDVERIAPCLPGAQLQEIEGDEYRGIVKVKVGPITAQYKGKATFQSKDDAAHVAVLKAEGRDTRGQGNASATITATLTPDGDGTAVKVVTDLTITGKVAQFGRGVLVDVSGKLLNQFVDCLENDLLSGDAVTASSEASASPPHGDPLLEEVGDKAPATAPAKAPATAPAKAPAEAPAEAAKSEAPASKAKPTKAAPTPSAASTTTKVADAPPASNGAGSGSTGSGGSGSSGSGSGSGSSGAATGSGSTASGPTTATPASAPSGGTSTTASTSTGTSTGGTSTGGSEPTVRKVDQKMAEPVDLLDAAGVPVAKRAIPAVAGILLILWFLRRRRRRSH